MDSVLLIGGLIAAFGALIVLLAALLVFRSRKAYLNVLLEREYGPELDLYETGIGLKSDRKRMAGQNGRRKR